MPYRIHSSQGEKKVGNCISHSMGAVNQDEPPSGQEPLSGHSIETAASEGFSGEAG